MTEQQLPQSRTSRTLLIATTNRGKLVEYQALLEGLPCDLIDLRMAGIVDEIPETGMTFEENARLKATGYAQLSGLITLADDSGLEIAALGGEPGIYSARYGGPGLTDGDRNRLVLTKLEGIPFHERLARFVCALALASPDGRVEIVQGSVPGVIDFAERGVNGFGYDPIFFLLDQGVMMAELAPEEKGRISHRAVAVAKARPIITAWFGSA